MTIEIPDKMWKRLIDHIEDNDYCFLCDNHPHSGHDEKCPLVAAQASPPTPELPRRDVPALVEALRIRALALTGEKWERNATRDMMKEAADMLKKLIAASSFSDTGETPT